MKSFFLRRLNSGKQPTERIEAANEYISQNRENAIPVPAFFHLKSNIGGWIEAGGASHLASPSLALLPHLFLLFLCISLSLLFSIPAEDVWPGAVVPQIKNWRQAARFDGHDRKGKRLLCSSTREDKSVINRIKSPTTNYSPIFASQSLDSC